MPLGSLRLAIKSRRKKQQKKYDKNVCKVGGCGKTGYKMRYCMSHYAQVADAMLFTAATGARRMTPSDQQALIDDINKIKKAQRHQKKKEVDSSNPSNKKNIHRSTTYADYNDNNFNTNNIHTKMRSSGNTRAQRSMSAIDHHNRHSLSHQQRGRASLVGDRKSIIASMISNNRKKMKDKDRNQRKVRSMVTGRGIEAGGGGEGPLDPPEPASNSSSGSDSDSDSERDSKSYSGSSVHYSDDSDYDNNAAYNLAQRKNDEGREKGKTVPRIVGARKPDKHRERLNRRRQYEEDEKIRIQIEEKEKKEGRKQRALLRRATERKNRGAPRTEVKDNLRRKDIDLDVNFWIDMEAEDKEQEEEGGEKEREKEEGIGGGTRTNDAGHVDEEHKYRTRESEEGSAGAQQKAQGKQKRKGGRKSRKRNSDLSHHQRHSSNNSRLSEEKEGSDGDRTFGLPMGVLQRQFARHTAGDVVEHKQRKTDARREERERMTPPTQGNTATDTGKTNEGSAAAKKHETGPRQIDAVIYEHDSIATACVALAYNESSCLPVYDIASGLCTRVFDQLDLCDIMMLKQMFRERAATQKAEEEKDKATQRKRDATTKELRLRHMQMLEEKRKNRVIKNSNNYNPFTSVDSDTDDEEGDDGISWLAGKNVKNNADKDRNDITDRYRALTDGNSIGNTSTNSTVMDSKHNVDDSIVVETSHETNGTGGHGHRQGQGQEHVQPSKGNDPLPVTLEELSLLKVSDLFAHTQKDARESVFAVSADRKLFKTVSLMLKLRLRYVLVLDDQALGKNDVVNVTEKRGVARVKGVITVENVLDMMYRVCVYAQNAILARYMNQSLRKLKMHRQHSSKLSKKDRREKEKNKEREREETREGRSSSSSSSSSLSMPRTLAMGQGRGKGALRDCYIHCVGGRTTVADTLAVLHSDGLPGIALLHEKSGTMVGTLSTDDVSVLFTHALNHIDVSKYTAFLARTSSPLTVYGYDRGVPQSLLTGNDTGRKKDVKNRTSTKGSIVIDINSNSDGAKGNANDANSTAAKQMTEKEGENDEHDVDAFDPSVLTLLSSILDAPAAAFTKLIKEQDPRSVSSSNVSESATEYEVNIGGVDAEKDTHVVALSPAKTVSENSAVSPTSAGPASLASPTSPVSALIEQAQKLKRKQQQKQQQQQQRLQRMNFDGASSGRSEIATVTADCSLFDLIRKLCGIHAYSCTPRTQVWVVESPPKKPRPVGVVRVVDVLQLLSPQRNHFF